VWAGPTADGMLRPGYGTLTWSYVGSGERIAEMSYETRLDGDDGGDGEIRLRYTSTRGDSEQRQMDYRIHIFSTPQPFGGWWFLCPRTGATVTKLYL
jgi:hypothetical protein